MESPQDVLIFPDSLKKKTAHESGPFFYARYFVAVFSNAPAIVSVTSSPT